MTWHHKSKIQQKIYLLTQVNTTANKNQITPVHHDQHLLPAQSS